MTATQSMTFAAVLDRFLAHTEERGIEPPTLKSYHYLCRNFLRPALGDIPVTDLRPKHFDCLGQAMKNHGYHSSTIKKAVTVAGGALRYAEREEWVFRNVARLADLPSGDASDIVVPKPADVVRLLEASATRDPDIHDYAFIMANTGMRPGEAMGLMPGDLSDVDILTIERAVDVSHCSARIKGTKTNRVRRISVDEETARIFRARDERPYLFGDGSDAGRTDLLGKRYAKIRRELGLDWPIRTLRHFHATQLIAEGHSIKDVADRLGHTNSLVTERVYVRFIQARDSMLKGSVGNVLTRAREAVAA